MLDADVLIENGTIVTMDPDRRVLKNSSVAVTGGKIVELGPAEELRARYRAAKSLDARRKTIMPGLVDLHAHGGRNLIKSIGEHLPGMEWRNLHEFINYHTPVEWHQVDSLLSALEKLKGGTTCSLYMGTMGLQGRDVERVTKGAEAAEKVGIRSIIGVGPHKPPWPRDCSTWADGRRVDRLVGFEEQWEGAEEAIRSWRGRGSRKVEMWVSVSRLLNPNPADQVYEESNERYIRPQAERVRGLMERYGVGFHVHGYGTAVKYAHEAGLGLLGPRTVLGHGWPLDLEAVEILAKTDTRVAHCPRAGRVYKFKGRCPVPELIDAGVIVGLGSDSCGLDRPFDSLWEDIFLAPRWQRRALNDARLVPPGKALEMATIDGARALGMEDRIGSVEAGKDADLILVDMFKPHIAPVFMEPSRLAHYVRGADVDTVLVQGEVLMESRVVKTVHEAEVLEWAQEEAERAVRMLGLEPLMEHPGRYWRCSSE